MRSTTRIARTLALFAFIGIATAGCSYVAYTSPSGGKVVYVKFLQDYETDAAMTAPDGTELLLETNTKSDPAVELAKEAFAAGLLAGGAAAKP